MCRIGTDKLPGTLGVCGCYSPYLETEFKESLADTLTKKERIEILKDYRKILEKELEKVNEEIKKLEEQGDG
ncbi:MAG: DUF5320 domain-containing protein [Candidatus Freyarchaeota archaeon]|nr:DUF5320 domain-containing protein [Candidatus Jordarchaeia archaeon]MBS7268791.1 DUF5320 domain-containing protein [Candidatus Jordarchaeia archaeon]MBS7278225.1 DUF5320 domain-containing protein [Candidatus Jordarchaeia archaeon]